MATTGHETEAVNVQGLKASLQKFKTDKVDGKADKVTVTAGSYNKVSVNAQGIVTAGDNPTTLADHGITDAYTKGETYNKTEVNGLVDTPHQNYVTVQATAQTTDATDVLPASGQAADTIYRVSNWDGDAGAFDVTKYSEYAWDDQSNPNKYVFLCVKTAIGEVFDISVYNNNATYPDLESALGTNGANVPETLRKGGMSVKFVHSVDNKYVQFRLKATSFSTTPSDWQGVDAEPTAGSHNLVESGGVIDYTQKIADKAILKYEQIETSLINKCNIIDGVFYVGDESSWFNRKLIYKSVSKGDVLRIVVSALEPMFEQYDRGILFFSSMPSSNAPFNYIMWGQRDIDSVIVAPDDGYIGIYCFFVSTGTMYSTDNLLAIQNLINMAIVPVISSEDKKGQFVYKELKNNYLGREILSKNLFDKSLIDEGYFDSNGNVVVSQYGKISYPIAVEPGQTYTTSIDFSGGAYHNFYTKSGKYLSSVSAANVSFAAPQDAYFVRLSMPSGSVNAYQFEKGSASTAYETYKYSFSDSVSDLGNKVAIDTPIMFDNPQMFLSLASGAIQDGNTITFETSSTSISYIGIRFPSIIEQLNSLYEKWIKFSIVFKVGGESEKLNISNLESYPATADSRNSVKENKDDYLIISQEIKVSSTQSGQIYVSCRMNSGASSHATLTFINCSYTLLKETDKELYDSKELLPKVIKSLSKPEQVKYTDLYCYSSAGTDTQTNFYGLQAISNAINSIQDNSKENRYRLHIEGLFHFTDCSQLIMPDVDNSEYSVIYAKPYVELIGRGVEQTVIFVDLSAGSFPAGKDYSYYQPVYIDCGGEVSISNMSILAKNCRYAVHLEYRGDNALRNIKNCNIIHYGIEGVENVGYQHAFGTGMGRNHVWNIENCYIESPNRDFAVHSYTADYMEQGQVNIRNCTFGKTGLSVSCSPNLSVMNVNVESCSFSKNANVAFSTYQRGVRTNANYKSGRIVMSDCNKAFLNSAVRGQVLRIDAFNKNHAVTFDTSASAFNIIIGNSQDGAKYFTKEAVWTQYGYFFKSGVAYGSKDIDEYNSLSSLGKLLGDCSATNKTLVITINSVSYTVTFDENLTNKDNSYVLGLINSVIGSVATASVFNINQEYYPEMKHLMMLTNSDSSEIVAGMAIVFNSTGIRKAKNTDGYIDGVCIDTVQPGESARVITKGELYTFNRYNAYRFAILENANNPNYIGKAFGVSATQDGYFDELASPKVARETAIDIVKF